MQKVNVSEITSLDVEPGILVNEREEGVICQLTTAIAVIIGAIF